MQKRCALMAICAGSLLWGAEWPTDGGNPQRTAWQQNEKILAKDNVKNLKVLWKLQLDNKPQEMHSLFAPLHRGRRENGRRSQRDRHRRGNLGQHLRDRCRNRKTSLEETFRVRSDRAPRQTGRSVVSSGADRGSDHRPPECQRRPHHLRSGRRWQAAFAERLRMGRMSPRRFRSATPTANTTP